MSGAHAIDALRCGPLGAWLTLVVLATLCLPAPSTAQSASSSPPSAEEVEASLGLGRTERRDIQRRLRTLGFNPGSPDGLFGPRTRKAIGRWQSSRGEPATGYLNTESARALREAGDGAPAPEPTGIVTYEDILSEAQRIPIGEHAATYRIPALSAIAKGAGEGG